MKSGRALSLISLGGFSVALGVVLFLARLLPHAVSTLFNAVHAVSYACQVVWAEISRNQIAFAVVGAILALLFVAWIGYTFVRGVRLGRAVHLPGEALPVRVLSLAADAGVDASRLVIVEDARAFAMTVGLRWPEVVVSTQALRTLSAAQLRAVLEHEAHHVRQREPLRRLVLAIALLWIPFQRVRARLRDYYVALSEVEADERVQDQHVLGGALLQMVAPPGTVAGFSPLDVRVERLVNPQYRQSGAHAIVFAVVALILAAGTFFVAPKSIAAVYGAHPSPTTEAHLDMCREEHERMLQSREASCGPLSTPQTCTRN